MSIYSRTFSTERPSINKRLLNNYTLDNIYFQCSIFNIIQGNGQLENNEPENKLHK